MLNAKKFLLEKGVIEASWRDYTIDYRNSPTKKHIDLTTLLEQYHVAKLEELNKIEQGFNQLKTQGEVTLLQEVLKV